MPTSFEEYHATPCWTCRRRRVKCDRTLPACHKCSISGQSCQGYNEKKPLRWTNSVASRGKLMGEAVPSIACPAPSIAKLLIDPALQDLSPPKRAYIKYFDQYCCAESTLCDTTPTNLFKEAMRLIPSSPVVLHTIVSVAALHQAQRETISSGNSPIESGLIRHAIPWDLPARNSKAFYDTLFHKQQALQHLQTEFLSPDLSKSESTIVSMLFFVWLEGMDSGRDSWKYHLKALRQIVQSNLFPTQQNANGFKSTLSGCCGYFEITYAIFEILGSTFIKRSQSYRPLFTAILTMDILKVSESQGWVGCPAELLYIISLSYIPPQSEEQGLVLKSHLTSCLRNFSPHRWAIADTNVSRVMPRYHLACAYKDAVSIYMAQVTFGWNKQKESSGCAMDSLDLTISHLTAVDPEDSYFKGLLWPAFVIGAEARSERQRMAITDIFGHLWTTWRCGNVRNALQVLREIWTRRDSEG